MHIQYHKCNHSYSKDYNFITKLKFSDIFVIFNWLWNSIGKYCLYLGYCISYTNLTIQSRKARETLAFVTISHWGTIASIQARFTQTLVELYFTKRSYKEKRQKYTVFQTSIFVRTL